MLSRITKDTRLCISLSGRPSNIGTRFHNYLYDELGLDYVYKAFTITDLPSAVAGIRGLGIRGCGVSMPFKEAVIPLIDELHDSARAIESVNTIVNEDGVLHAYNTDYQAVADLLREHEVDPGMPAAVAGSGGMAKAVVAALRDSGFTDVSVIARNEETGAALARQYGFDWRTELDGRTPGLLVNATPVGMTGGRESEQLPFPAAAVAAASTVFDVVAMPPETPLIRAARAHGLPVITGAEVIALQAAQQFALYTGVTPTPEQVRRASEFSRSQG
ncbi:shikimate dehydrogenase [Rhodococcus ruber]|uniref:shikimate 5-dehydrogenase n=1 Tax=Rhodococcus ruber TaxID=1830 RepID=UPI001AE7036B|nr:shikimate 5-dehydrogenase [Rhodococcus ruber]MBP2210933.1 shikimate dehydrogenase [Rhodococcus ruber]WKK12776.1 shikimate 5-dehydrogenase [Rhodococcus ruber]